MIARADVPLDPTTRAELEAARAARGLSTPRRWVAVAEVARRAGRSTRTIRNHARGVERHRPRANGPAFIPVEEAERILAAVAAPSPVADDGTELECIRCGESFPRSAFNHGGNQARPRCNDCWDALYGRRRRVTCAGGCGRRFQTRRPEGMDATCRACARAAAGGAS